MNPQQNSKITKSAIFNPHINDLGFSHSRSLIQLAQRPSQFKKNSINQFNQLSNRKSSPMKGSQSQIKM